MPYADYGFYANVYGGSTIAEADFRRLAVRASMYIDAVTGRAARSAMGDDLTAVQMAVCALAELYVASGKLDAVAFSGESVVQSETVGGWSRNYGSRAVSAADMQLEDKRREDVLLTYLGGTSLMAPVGHPVTRGGTWP